MVSAALAAPLLKIMGHQSFAICLVGPSRIGKTTATIVGGSGIGVASSEDLASWKITDAGLEEKLTLYNDSFFAIDEFSLLGTADAQKYARLGSLAYKIVQGAETERHSSYLAGNGGRPGSWRGIMMTSNEKSVRDLARSAGTVRQPGETIRLIDVPADVEALGHIFDRATTNSNKQFRRIANACKDNHGVAQDKFIRDLLSTDLGSLEDRLQRRKRHFERAVFDVNDGPLARDLAGKFGCLYAAGREAIGTELLPWERNELLNAIKKFYFAARDLLPDDGVDMREGWKGLKSALTGLPRIGGNKRHHDCKAIAGFRIRERDCIRYVLRKESFNDIFSSAQQQMAVTDRLINEGCITLAKRKSNRGSRMPKTQINWPDGTRRRSVEIKMPRTKGTTSKH